MKLSDFVKQSTVPAKLIRAVVRQVGGWEDFQQIAKDVAGNGADDGYKGFIYYVDTVAFTKRNRRAILELALAKFFSTIKSWVTMAQHVFDARDIFVFEGLVS